MPKIRLLLALLLALPPLTQAARAEEAGTLRIGINGDPDMLDPTYSRTYVGTLVMTAICDKLFDFDAALNIVPVLASGYESVDPKTLLIHIRPGITFQNGEALDAAAVAYSLERHLTAEGSIRRSEIGAMDKADAVDPLTVRVVMKQPFSPFIAALTDRAGMMVAPKAAEAAGKDFGLHPVCVGPYRFGERVAQDHITLERAPGYWRADRVHFDTVVYRVITDSSIRLSNLRAGALDLSDIAPLDVDAVKNDPKLSITLAPSLGYGGLTINVGDNQQAQTPLGRDARVRQALNLAIDRAALSQVVYGGMYTPNAQATSVVSPLYDKDIAVPARDVSRAKALLKEAGVTVPLRVDLLVGNTPQGIQTGEVLQSMVAEAGFDLRVTNMEFGTLLARVTRGDFQMALSGWSGLLDVDSNVWTFLHTGGALNWERYSNQTVDRMLDRARVDTDPAARLADYDAVWKQENRDLPILYLYSTRIIAGMSRRIQGFTLLSDGLYRLLDVRPAS